MSTDTLHAAAVPSAPAPESGPARAKTHVSGAAVARYVVLVILALICLTPLYLFLTESLKSQAELAANPIGLPREWRWSNFAEAWTTGRIGSGLLNSLIIVTGTVLLVVVVSSLAAYAMARLQVAGSSGVFVYLLVAASLPIQLFLVPLFYLMAQVHLYDTHLGLILIHAAVFSPFATLLLRSFMIDIPKDFEEAARIDGANELTVFARILLPMAWPGVMTVALTVALQSYNEFLLAVTFIQSDEFLPVSSAMFNFKQGFTQDYSLISAAGVIMAAPMIIGFLLMQRKFMDGLTSSGLGGN
ncbi:carbohydrate ABC transporter permease [Brachybacterium sacelli]|uniref:Raffinose/stachyose/melibiose transport system permease protein n=2 Tax=Brachybacterium sacelli TaxID=173364 RepID=A0ABS4WYX1_9MICO|nr:carbohydrate ABC transporter permease [Brachybacterium sacelli]MBP2381409.1 raffinose/stachyose/melibiose transport system permease protein [Brachybacterium sacelli]